MFKIEVTGTTLEELASAIVALAAQFGTTPAADKPATRKRATTEKAEPEPATEKPPLEKVEDKPAETARTEAAPSADAVTKDQVVAMMMKYGAAFGDEKLIALMTPFGGKLGNVPVERYGELLAQGQGELDAPAEKEDVFA